MARFLPLVSTVSPRASNEGLTPFRAAVPRQGRSSSLDTGGPCEPKAKQGRKQQKTNQNIISQGWDAPRVGGCTSLKNRALFASALCQHSMPTVVTGVGRGVGSVRKHAWRMQADLPGAVAFGITARERGEQATKRCGQCERRWCADAAIK